MRCLGPEEAKEMIKEVHSGECGEHQGKKKLYRCLLQMGYYWPTMKKDVVEFVKKVSQLSSTSQLDSYPSTRFAQHGHPMALPHLEARFGRASQPTITWIHMDISGYRIFY